MLASAQAAPIDKFVAQVRGRSVTLGLPPGMAIERAAFDAALVQAAIASGAAFLPETVATVEPHPTTTDRGRAIQLRQRGGAALRAVGRVILAADGLGHASVQHIDAFRSSTVRRPRVGLGLTVAEPRGHFAAGAIHMAIARHGYVGLVRTADDNLNAAAAVDPAALKEADCPATTINRILRDAGMPQLTSITGVPCRGTLPLTRSSLTLAAERVFLLGDAAGYVEPFTGEGMGWAIASAVSVVPYALRRIRLERKSGSGMAACSARSDDRWPVGLPVVGGMFATACGGRRSANGSECLAGASQSDRASNSCGASPFASECVMNVVIAGCGTAVPEHQIEQNDAAEQASQICCQTQVQQRLLKTLYRRAGVHTRHSVVLESGTNGRPAQQSFYTSLAPQGPTTAERMAAYEMHAPPLACEAAQNALASAETSPGEITHLVTVSCSGFSAPGVDVSLLADLGLPAGTARTNVGFMGCHGALNGLRVATAFASDPRNCVLLCAVELCSLHHQYEWDPDQIVANALFGDGAGALVLRGDSGGARSCAWSTSVRSCCRTPPS